MLSQDADTAAAGATFLLVFGSLPFSLLEWPHLILLQTVDGGLREGSMPIPLILMRTREK